MNIINSLFSTGSLDVKQEWNFRGCQHCYENKTEGRIVKSACQVQYKGECIVKLFNDVLFDSRRNFYGLHGMLVCDLLIPKFPEFKFDTRIPGWKWFFIEDEWIRFHFTKNIYDCDIIKFVDTYEPFHKAD